MLRGKIHFYATNNVVEYEAVIMALKIIKEIGIQKSIIFSDSQLVVNPRTEPCQIREKSLLHNLLFLMERIKDRQDKCKLHLHTPTTNEEESFSIEERIVDDARA